MAKDGLDAQEFNAQLYTMLNDIQSTNRVILSAVAQLLANQNGGDTSEILKVLLDQVGDFKKLNLEELVRRHNSTGNS